MADTGDIAARREARRLKILANAENRIKRITSVPEVKLDDNIPIEDKSHKDCYDTTNHRSESPERMSLEDDLMEPANATEDDVTEALKEEELFGTALKTPRTNSSQEQKSVNYRVIIVMLLGLLVRYINLIFYNCEEILGIDLSFLHIDKIFMPFLIYVATVYYFFPTKLELPSSFKFLLSVQKIKGKYVNVLITIFNYAALIFKDMMIYFFSFVFLDTVFALFNVDDDYFHMSYVYKPTE